MQTVFIIRDLDHDREGRLTRNEMRGFLLNLTDRKGEVERFLETVDEDNKGFVLHEGETTWYYSLITDILAYHNSRS